MPKRGERLVTHAQTLKICNLDRRALKITKPSTFTTHNRHGPHRGLRVANIINDCFEPEHFRNKRIVELGPGHYAFALLARHLGAEVVCVDREPIFVQLGKYFGFEMLEMEIEQLSSEAIGGRAQGLWMKGAFNACRYQEDEQIVDLAQRISDLVVEDGWGWLVTANKADGIVAEKGQDFVEHRIELQRTALERLGWDAAPIVEPDRKRYGINYQNARYLFTRGLK